MTYIDDELANLQRDLTNLKDLVRDHAWRIECLESANAARETSASVEVGAEENWHITGWNGRSYRAEVDSDGDFGITDHNEYAIVVSVAGAAELYAALGEFLESKDYDPLDTPTDDEHKQLMSTPSACGEAVAAAEVLPRTSGPVGEAGPTFKMEVGRRYRRKNGTECEITGRDDDKVYPWDSDDGNSYTDKGTVFCNSECGDDIVAYADAPRAEPASVCPICGGPATSLANCPHCDPLTTKEWIAELKAKATEPASDGEKSLGQIAYEAYGYADYLWRVCSNQDTWERVGSAVAAAATKAKDAEIARLKEQMRQTQDLLDHVKGENDVIEEVRRTLIRERDAALARATAAEAEAKRYGECLITLNRIGELGLDKHDMINRALEDKKGD